MTTFSLMILQFFSKSNRVQAVDEIDKLCKFQDNLTSNAYYVYTKFEFSTEIGYFTLADCPICFKFNRVEAIDEMDTICKFHGNPTINVDFIMYTRKTNGRLKPHDISSAGF